MLQHYEAHDGPVVRGGEVVGAFERTPPLQTSICFHPSGNFLMSASNDATLKVRLGASV